MNSKIEIREEELADIEAIRDVTKAAFRDEPHSENNEYKIVDALREGGDLTVSLVAEEEDVVVGHVALSPVTISDGAEDWYGLGPISVAPEYQRRGVGSALMRHALDVLKNIDAAGCVVLGDPGYYSRLGFEVVKGLTFFGVPAEYFQAISFCGDYPAGEVTYQRVFYEA